MTTQVRQLKDENNTAFYPQTVKAAISDLAPIQTNEIANNAINSSKISNGAVTSNKIDFTTLTFGNYSLDEVDTGFTWIDGKTIYKKTVNFGSLPNASGKSVNHNISFDRMIHIEGLCQYQNGICLSLPSSNNSYLNAQTELTINTTQITINTGGQDRSQATAYITLYYTKAN